MRRHGFSREVAYGDFGFGISKTGPSVEKEVNPNDDTPERVGR
jgi:hypothetical protein